VRPPGQEQRCDCDRDIQRRRNTSGRCHVVHAQQIETGQQAAEDRARNIASVKEPQPGHAPRRCFQPARHRRQRRPHEQRRRQQADGAYQAPQQNASKAVTHAGHVNLHHLRHHDQHQDSANADADLEQGIDSQRVMPGGHHPGQQQAAQAHPAHVSAQKHPQRDCRRTNDKAKQLEPDDFVDKCGASAADEQQQQKRKLAVQ